MSYVPNEAYVHIFSVFHMYDQRKLFYRSEIIYIYVLNKTNKAILVFCCL